MRDINIDVRPIAHGLLTLLITSVIVATGGSFTLVAADTNVLSADTGLCEVVETPTTWLLQHPHGLFTLSKSDGGLVGLGYEKHPLLTLPATIRIRDGRGGPWIALHPIDKKSAPTWSGDLLVTRFSPQGEPAYEVSVTVTCEAEALRLAVEVIAPREPDHEVQVQFLFPVPVQSDADRVGGPEPSPGFTHAFWATDGAPFAAAPQFEDGRTVVYRTDTYLPWVSLYNSELDVGLSVASPFEVPKPGLTFAFRRSGSATASPAGGRMEGADQRFADGNRLEVTVHSLRVGAHHPARAELLLLAHKGDWRPGLAAIQRAYPEYFAATSERVKLSDGYFAMGRPTVTEAQIWEYGRRGITWQEYHLFFPFYGLYLPDTEEWPVLVGYDESATFADWESPNTWLPKYGKERMHHDLALWQKAGIQSYLYYQVFEARHEYAAREFPQDIARSANGQPLPAFMAQRLLNPDPDLKWGRHVLNELHKLMEAFPEADGVFIDRLDYRDMDFAHDDGVSMVGDRPAYQLSLAQEKSMRVIAEYVHGLGKGIWANSPTSVEVTYGVDGLMSESAQPAAKLQYLGVNRPMVLLIYDSTPEATEKKLQTALAYGYQPSVTSGVAASQYLEEKYRQTFELLQGRTWVLDAHALRLRDDLQGNIFRSPGGSYLVSVVSPHRSQLAGRDHRIEYDVPVTVRLPQTFIPTHCYALSGDWMGVTRFECPDGADRRHDAAYDGRYAGPYDGTYDGPGKTGERTLHLPAHLSSSLIVMADHQLFPVARVSAPVLIRGEPNIVQLWIDPALLQAENISLVMPWRFNQPLTGVRTGETIEWLVEVPQEINVGELHFHVKIDGQSYPFSAWVKDAVEIADPGAVALTGSQGTLSLQLTNHTDRALAVTLRAVVSDGEGRASVPARLTLDPHEARIIDIDLVMGTKRSRVTLIAEVDGRLVKRAFDVDAFDLLYASDFATHADGWIPVDGTWRLADDQMVNTDLGSPLTNNYLALKQEGRVLVYEWEVSMHKAAAAWAPLAGVHFLADSGTLGNHGNSYFLFQSSGVLKLYKSVDNVLVGQWEMPAYAAQVGRTYRFKVIFNTATGLMQIYIDDQLVREWTDPKPIQSGDYVAFRTNNTEAGFSYLRVSVSR